MAQPLTYLLDTNIWLELLLDQDRAGEVKQLLETGSVRPVAHYRTFRFTLIGVILLQAMGRSEALMSFSKDLFADNSVQLLALDPDDVGRLDYRCK